MHARWSSDPCFAWVLRRRTTHVLLFAVWCLASAAHAAPAAKPAAAAKPSGPPAFSLEHAITLKAIQAITWSRDGRRIAFVVNAPDTAENTTNQDLWLWDAASNTCRALTR